MQSISEICEKYKIENYTINNDGSIDVNGYVYLNDMGLIKLPLKFNYVSGGFNCSCNGLVSLEGSPKGVGDDFYCHRNALTSLEFSPEKVGGNFSCSDNKLTSLEFSPNRIGGDFYCNDNEITDLYGISDNIGKFLYCHNNPIGSISDEVDMDFIRAFNAYKVVKGNTISLKRLKYVMELFEKPINLEKIKEFYAIN